MESPKDRSKCNPSEESSIAVSFQLDPLVSSNGNNNPSENNPQEQQCEPNTNNENNKSSKALAKGSSLMLASIIKDFDSKAQDTLKSQDHLNCIIDRHTRELDQLLDDALLPFVMQHAAKISGVRMRVSSLNSLLKSIQRRIDNIDLILSVSSPQGIDVFLVLCMLCVIRFKRIFR
uniref:Biogenesis of lysosome-related organelles complex 1 subunit 7 n=1 Tax=Manihot esculenta TaxID=3983 RepID=A0A2C9VRP9_MANES